MRAGAREARITASIGVAWGALPERRERNLLREADAAMYRAKRAGRARLAVFRGAPDPG